MQAVVFPAPPFRDAKVMVGKRRSLFGSSVTRICLCIAWHGMACQCMDCGFRIFFVEWRRAGNGETGKSGTLRKKTESFANPFEETYG